MILTQIILSFLKNLIKYRSWRRYLKYVKSMNQKYLKHIHVTIFKFLASFPQLFECFSSNSLLCMTPKTQQLFSNKQQFTKACPQNFLRNILFKFPKPLKNLKMTNRLAALSLFENSHWKLFCTSGVLRYVFA